LRSAWSSVEAFTDDFPGGADSSRGSSVMFRHLIQLQVPLPTACVPVRWCRVKAADLTGSSYVLNHEGPWCPIWDALYCNAVKDFRSRIRENSDDLRAFRILTNSATIRSYAFFCVSRSFTALPVLAFH
jgi:hypothetical protein